MLWFLAKSPTVGIMWAKECIIYDKSVGISSALSENVVDKSEVKESWVPGREISSIVWFFKIGYIYSIQFFVKFYGTGFYVVIINRIAIKTIFDMLILKKIVILFQIYHRIRENSQGTNEFTI